MGTTAHFPRHALSPAGWQGERTRIWLHNQVDPTFNDMAESGVGIDSDQVRETFLPRYFTINGKSGAFSSHAPDVVLKGRIGQPMLVRILNAGLFVHSDHLHANHFYVVAENNSVRERAVLADTWIIEPEDRVDVLVPFIRPPRHSRRREHPAARPHPQRTGPGAGRQPRCPAVAPGLPDALPQRAVPDRGRGELSPVSGDPSRDPG